MSHFIRKLIQEKWEGNRERDAIRLAGQSLPEGVQVVSGLPYHTDGHPMHTLNLYRPKQTQHLLPTVIDIHGGGWMYGDRELNKAYCMYLASQGYAVLGMSYRLIPETDLKGQIQDIFQSLHWLSQNASSYGFDLNSVLLTGDSAGGHLAGLTTCILCNPDLQSLYEVTPPPFSIDTLAIVHGVCDIYHFHFLTPVLDQAVSNEYCNMLLGTPWKQSPLCGHASFQDTALHVSLPPIFVVYSEPDLYYAQSKHLIAFLQKHHLPHQHLHWSKKQGEHLTHVFEVGWWDWAESKETNLQMLRFFDQNCTKQKEK